MTQTETENKLNRSGNRRGMSPNSQNNIKGVKGARPTKDKSLIENIRKKLKETCPYDAKRRTWMDALVDAELRFALNDTAARRDLLDRLCGRPVAPMEHTGEVTLKVVDDND